MPILRSVRARIIGTLSLLVLLLIGIVLVAVLRPETAQVDADAVDKASLTAAALADIDAEFTLQLETTRAFPVTKDWSFAEAFRESIARVQADIEEAQALQSAPADSEALAALNELAKDVEQVAIAGEGVFLFTDVADNVKAAAARSQIETSIAGLRPAVAELIDEQQQEINLALTSTSSEEGLRFWALLGFAGLVFVVGAWSALTLTQSIRRPLASLQATAKAIANGDVASRPEISGATDFEALARDFDRMIVALVAKQTAEAGIAKAEARYRQLAERTADLVFRVDIQKGLTYANPAWERVTGYSLEELSAGPQIAGRLVHPDHWHSFAALWKGMLAGNIPQSALPMKWQRKDGQVIWLAFTFIPSYDEEGRLIAIEGTARDTTTLSHLVKEVRQRDEQVRLFLNLSNATATAIGFNEAADIALEAVLELLSRAEAGFLMAYNQNRDLLEVHGVRGLDRQVLSKLVAKPGEGLMGRVFESGEACLYSSPEELAGVGDLSADGEDILKQDAEEPALPQGIICAPVGVGQRPFGCLVLVTFSEASRFQASDLDLLQTAAVQVALPLENAYLRAETELRAITDGLTGLYNRAYFHQRLSEEIDRAKRYDHGLALVIMDVDNFRSYNDTQGHVAADKVLCLAADSIRSQMRRSDIACRYGGDEFVAMLMHADANRAQAVVERTQRSLASKLKGLPDAVDADLGLTAGVACYPDDATTADDLVRLADISLHSAKLNGSKAAQTV